MCRIISDHDSLIIRRTTGILSFQCAYDTAGRLSRMTDYDGSYIEYGYGAAGKVTSVTDTHGG
jgi:hypothetical protein